MRHVFLLTAFLSMFFAVSFHALAQDEEGEVRVNGVVFNIAKDRKIEKVGGIYEPEGLDKYFKRYLVDMNARLDRIESQIAETNKKLDQISLELNKAEETPAKTEEPAPVPAGKISRKGSNPFL